MAVESLRFAVGRHAFLHRLHASLFFLLYFVYHCESMNECILFVWTAVLTDMFGGVFTSLGFHKDQEEIIKDLF